MGDNKNTGNWGEEQAVGYLRAKNYTILTTNWRFKQREIDIIAQEGNFIVFVEVKTRKDDEYGEPETAVSLKKQKFLISAANQYLLENNIDLEARFDIISILINNNKVVLKHLPEAFYPLV